jgi:signal transduction histidine kinase
VSADDPRAVLPAWPALVALATVVVLSFAMFGLDVVIDHNTAEHTDELVGNSLRSITLADDLRYQAYRLSVANLSPDQIASIAEQIDADARAYDPLATSEGENDEWKRLQGLLSHLRHEQPLPTNGSSATLVSEIETSIGRLVAINQDEARRGANEIGDLHWRGLVLDAVVGTITLGCVGLVALALVRTLRRQRALLGIHLASLEDRAQELAAFATRTSHDLKGPLSPIRGYADLLSLEASPDVREMSGRIARAVDKMNAVIEEMLELSVHGRTLPGRVAVTPAVLEVVEELRGELGDAEVGVVLGQRARPGAAKSVVERGEVPRAGSAPGRQGRGPASRRSHRHRRERQRHRDGRRDRRARVRARVSRGRRCRDRSWPRALDRSPHDRGGRWHREARLDDRRGHAGDDHRAGRDLSSARSRSLHDQRQVVVASSSASGSNGTSAPALAIKHGPAQLGCP